MTERDVADLTDSVYTVPEAAKVCKVTIDKMYQLVREGAVVSTRLSARNIRITRGELVRFLNGGPTAR